MRRRTRANNSPPPGHPTRPLNIQHGGAHANTPRVRTAKVTLESGGGIDLQTTSSISQKDNYPGEGAFLVNATQGARKWGNPPLRLGCGGGRKIAVPVLRRTRRARCVAPTGLSIPRRTATQGGASLCTGLMNSQPFRLTLGTGRSNSRVTAAVEPLLPCPLLRVPSSPWRLQIRILTAKQGP